MLSNRSSNNIRDVTMLSSRPQVIDLPVARPPERLLLGPYLHGVAHRLGRLMLALAGVAIH